MRRRPDIAAGLPTVTRVLGQRFDIRVVPNLTVPTGNVAVDDVHAHEDWVHEDTMQVLGACDRDRNVISLDPDTGYDRLRETFLHEHLHAIITKANLHHDLLASNEEAVVARLSPILLQFLRDNPKAVEFLQS